MYWAVLNHTRIAGLCRTSVSTTTAVTPAISIGQGCSNNATDAMNGTKPTDVLTLASEMRRNDESERTPRRANSATALKVSRESKTPCPCSGKKIATAAATDTAPISTYSLTWFSETRSAMCASASLCSRENWEGPPGMPYQPTSPSARNNFAKVVNSAASKCTIERHPPLTTCEFPRRPGVVCHRYGIPDAPLLRCPLRFALGDDRGPLIQLKFDLSLTPRPQRRRDDTALVTPRRPCAAAMRPASHR